MSAMPDGTLANPEPLIADLRRRLAEREAELTEALEQQTATAEVLQVINSSPRDLAPVFGAILDKAQSLCGAAFGLLFTCDGEHIQAAALHNIPAGFAGFLRRGAVTPAPGTTLARAIEEREPVQMIDAMAEGPYRDGDPFAVRAIEAAGVRTVLSVPLVKDDAVHGVIGLFRQEVRPFTNKQITLLQNFAAQAVIAMENARLLTETREALDQQTATAEVLQVINSSPGDLAPVFNAMVERAAALCEADEAAVRTFDGSVLHLAATHGPPGIFEELMRLGPSHPDGLYAAIALGDSVTHVVDVRETEPFRNNTRARERLELRGIRSWLAVALRKEGALLGIINVHRRSVRPFTEKQIALLQNFAAQAVIAMENARLLTETREALEQQTATAEVLQVINSSRGDLAPVFDAMLEKAMALCGAAFGIMATYDGTNLRPVAMQGIPPRFAAFAANPANQPGPGGATPRLAAGAPFVHVTDLKEEEAYRSGDPYRRALVDVGGARSLLAVPLRKDGVMVGQIGIYRQEVRPFTDRQVALLQNFAAQAVIAMENARLLTETREALEQQTATAEVLQVINSSPGDLVPVFDAILEKGMRVCEAAFGHLDTYDGELFRTAAVHGVPTAFAEYRTRNPPSYGPGTGPARMLEGERMVHHLDLKEEEAYRVGEPNRRALVDLGGAHSALHVALVKDEAFLGFMTLFRREVRPFSGKQIALLQNFAAQAVIAMDNARLLDEIRQRQAELRITFDNMLDGVAMFDERLRLAAWNRNFQELLRLPDELLAKRSQLDTYIRHLVERGEFGETDADKEIARLRARIGDHYSFERTRPDGTVIEVRHNPMPGGGIVLIYSDITERKRSEAEIKAARDAAEAAYRDLKAAQANLIQAEKMASLGQLTAGIAHEIKNPLNFVNNFAGLSVELLDELKETAAPAISALRDDKRAEIDDTINMLSGNLEKITEHGRRADNIVTSMLEHSRGSSGERRRVDLNTLIEDAVNLAYHGGRARDQNFNIALERDYAETIAPIELVPQDITRVCLNLFGNGFYAAIKRQREGSDRSFKPTLRVSTRDLGGAVEMRVRDNGTGIAPEHRDKLFQPFFTTKPSGEGTGLGLSISYDIVTQQHDHRR